MVKASIMRLSLNASSVADLLGYQKSILSRSILSMP
jgi:hypothetical protein